jgi:hypothetical protein
MSGKLPIDPGKARNLGVSRESFGRGYFGRGIWWQPCAPRASGRSTEQIKAYYTCPAAPRRRIFSGYRTSAIAPIADDN